MKNWQLIKIGLTVLAWVSFIISATFTIKLVTANAVTGTDKILFGSLGLASQAAQVLFFSIGLFCVMLAKSPMAKAIGGVCLVIGIGFTILSIAGTMGGLAVGNAEKNEKSFVYQSNVSTIAQIDQTIKDKQSAIDAMPSNYSSKRNQVAQEIEGLLAQKASLTATNQDEVMNGKGNSQNALYVMLANWSGDTVENCKFKVMAAYGIGLETIGLMAAVFAMYGEQIIYGRKRENEGAYIDNNDNTEFEIGNGQERMVLIPASQLQRLGARKTSTSMPQEDYTEKEIETEISNGQKVKFIFPTKEEIENSPIIDPERPIGFTAKFEGCKNKYNPNSPPKIRKEDIELFWHAAMIFHGQYGYLPSPQNIKDITGLSTLKAGFCKTWLEQNGLIFKSANNRYSTNLNTSLGLSKINEKIGRA